MGLRLLSVSAFWQNNQERGLGFTILDERGDLEATMAILRESYSAMWSTAARVGREGELAFDLRAQLYQFALRKGHLKDEEMYLALANIWLLVEMGEMKEDEFNGLQWVYGL